MGSTTTPMLVYIAGPMSGIDDNNFPAFEEAAAELRKQGYTVINPSETVGGAPDHDWQAMARNVYMRIDFHHLLTANMVVLLPGWRDSEGAKAEAVMAKQLGLVMREYRGEDLRPQVLMPEVITCQL